MQVNPNSVPVYPTIPANARAVFTSTVGFDWNNHAVPYVMQYNLNIQREIVPGTVLMVGYVGSRGVHMLTADEQNPSTPGVGPNSGVIYGVLNSTGTSVIDNPRQNPNLSQFTDMIPTTLSRYNSLETSLTRRLSRNFQAQVSYTFSKCMDDGTYLGSYATNIASNWGNPFNQAYDWSVCNYDIKHVLSVNALYTLPFHGNRIVEGWQVSGILRSSSGLPFSVLDGIDASGFGPGVSTRPDSITGNVNPILGNAARWFDPAQFTLAPIGALGNLGRATLRGPTLNNTDFALAKDTRISERTQVQFRAEFFNILNHTNYAMPNNSLYTGLSAGRPVPNTQAGRITNIVGTPRQIQFGLKFVF